MDQEAQPIYLILSALMNQPTYIRSMNIYLICHVIPGDGRRNVDGQRSRHPLLVISTGSRARICGGTDGPSVWVPPSAPRGGSSPGPLSWRRPGLDRWGAVSPIHTGMMTDHPPAFLFLETDGCVRAAGGR